MTPTHRIVPYNDIWLDCVNNNLMSILISHHSSFEKLPLTFKTQYWKKIINQKFLEGSLESMLHQGLMLPKVQYDTEQVYHYLRFEDQLLEPSDIPFLDKMIQGALDKQKYVFLDVDRFFYSSGREAGKTHFIHPTFIHGTCASREAYTVIEDCLSPGRMHDYQTPLEVIKESTQYLMKSGQKVRFIMVSVHEESIRNFNDEFSVQDSFISELSSNLLDDKVVYLEQYDLSYQLGLKTLTDYVEEFEEVVGNLNDTSIFALRSSSFAQNHKKNNRLFKLLEDQSSHPNLYKKLAEQSLELSHLWEIYRTTVIRMIVSNHVQNQAIVKLEEIVKKEYNMVQTMKMATEASNS
ncbi:MULTISPECIES: hypothetical protein [unclassified Paenibacillus]|uniref:hypothetical protein n=1 Tax=unclassified Paenibacillus TaxID=185978 RepID=UPI0030F6F78F